MGKVNLNNSPDLTMEQITKQLFNNDFMSDVEYRVEGKTVYAHSWELMKRSVVFREQFIGTLGENKLIPINDTTYRVFYQFLRYIYTDECDIEDDMICEMLKLAVKYKIVKLETKLLNMRTSYDTQLKLFEFCVANKYMLYYKNALDLIIIRRLHFFVEIKAFLQISSNALEVILKSNHIPPEMTEVKLFDATMRWINMSCKMNNIPLAQRQVHFDKLIRLIRFPNMTSKEFRNCVDNNPGLIAGKDVLIISKNQLLKQLGKHPKYQWPSESRIKYNEPWIMQKRSSNHKWETKFTVVRKLILHGLRFGSVYSDFELQIDKKKWSTSRTKRLRYNFKDSQLICNTICLGESVKLKPNVEYTMRIKALTDEPYVYLRKSDVSVITTPCDLVTFTEIGQQLFEMVFK